MRKAVFFDNRIVYQERKVNQMRQRIIGIACLVGSDSDLTQMEKGLRWLYQQVKDMSTNGVSNRGVHVRSAHRHPIALLVLLFKLVRDKETQVIVTGAGKTNALSGMVETILLRIFYPLAPALKLFHVWNVTRKDILKIRVLGVAFEGSTEESTQAAMLSTRQVPSSQVIWAGADGKQLVGSEGFLAAMKLAATGLPAAKVPEDKPVFSWGLHAALEEIDRRKSD